MNSELFEEVARTLTEQFHVDPALVRPEATLDALGMDSLTLMEFVFAVEDRFDTRIPEGKLDPRHAGLTLERVVEVLEDVLDANATAPVASSVSGNS